MKIEYNKDQTAAMITGDHSRLPVFITTEALNEEFGGNAERAFHWIKSMASKNLLPIRGSHANPLTRRHVALARENEEVNYRKHFYVSLIGRRVKEDTGYDFIHGIATQDDSCYYLFGFKIRKPSSN